MDTYIDSRFERLEKALATLIDSVTKYHPSAIQAEELKAADNELCKGLEEVQIHQNNHLKIQQLRQLSASLDVQIRETLTSLATTRKDIVTTQVTVYPSEPNYPIVYEELLNYARRISKTSMPPAAILNALGPSQESQTPLPDSQAQAGMTPSAPTPNPTQSPAPANGALSSTLTDQTIQQAQASLNTSLPESMSQYLNPLSGQLFFPWPLEDKIRSGALASNQILLEQGIDPKGYDPVAEEDRKRKEEEERKEKEEKEKQERAEREKKAREEVERMRKERQLQKEKEQAAWRRASTAPGASGEAAVGAPPSAKAEKKQFQFTNLDDLDDDDDED
ncbi:mediator of rna polymerase ii transcription subunit 4 [Trichoderma arundinaceum]|uniref:Mediator of RNA polymerase II transcription subunit 4 n=1 Tax=Trichoderma arundinaceum TaxID=490622 RepID=A0A395NR79_TRIAR|nr:mediator of rna polymerase ii transcription subunit 4 [Trichoderma arundinaceum]